VAQSVVLARHGETEWSLSGRHTGTTDLPLTEKGRRQAKALAPELRSWAFSLVLTSPLQRALETCRLAGYGEQARVRSDLVEWNYGRYEGLTSKQIEAVHPNWSLWKDGGPGGEIAADVGRRADRVIAEVRRVSGDVLISPTGTSCGCSPHAGSASHPRAGATMPCRPRRSACWDMSTPIPSCSAGISRPPAGPGPLRGLTWTMCDLLR